MPKAKDEEPTEKAKDKKLTDQDKFKQVKKDIREKMMRFLFNTCFQQRIIYNINGFMCRKKIF